MTTNKLSTELEHEVLERMTELQLDSSVINDFKNGQINCSTNTGALYPLPEKFVPRIHEFEEKNKSLVYHVIRNNTKCGILLTLLYIKQSPTQMEDKRSHFSNGEIYAFEMNISNLDYSNFRCVELSPSKKGGLMRIS